MSTHPAVDLASILRRACEHYDDQPAITFEGETRTYRELDTRISQLAAHFKLYEHPAIQRIAVIGLPDEKWGDAVSAVIALKDNQSLTLEQLRNFCEGKLAHYKIPLRLFEVEALPRNPSGKILKYQLRESLNAGH